MCWLSLERWVLEISGGGISGKSDKKKAEKSENKGENYDKNVNKSLSCFITPEKNPITSLFDPKTVFLRPIRQFS